MARQSGSDDLPDGRKRVYVRGVPSDEQIDSMLAELGFPMDDKAGDSMIDGDDDHAAEGGPPASPAPGLDDTAALAVADLLAGRFRGPAVLGMPTAWEGGGNVDEGSPWRDQVFRLFVGAPSDRPTEVWELVIAWPGQGSVIDETEFRLHRIHPEPPTDGLVYGCLNLDAITVVGFCDHRTQPRKARVLNLGGVEGVPALRQALEGQNALDIEGISDVEGDTGFADIAAYFATRLPPIARAIVDGVLADPAPEPASVPPFTLLPPYPQWGPGEWNPEDALERPLTDLSVGGLPDFNYAVAESDEPDTFSDAGLCEIVEDHGWFSVGGTPDNPAGGWSLSGWASWAEGTLLTVGRSVGDGPTDPEAWCMALPDFEEAEPENPLWWLELLSALALCAYGNTAYWQAKERA